MVHKCWHYQFTKPLDELREIVGKDAKGEIGPRSDNCTKSFDLCASEVECEGLYPACFALARLIEQPGKNTLNSANETTIISAGCLPPPDGNAENHCDTNCLGDQRRNGNYYCCCTLNKCNGQLIPKITPLSAPTITSSNTTLPSFPSSSSQANVNSSNNLSVTVIIVLTLLAAIFMITCFKRTWLKRKHRDHSRSNISVDDVGANQRHELQDLRTNVIDDPMSFGDENNHHFHYGQREEHHNNNSTFTNYNSKVNHHDGPNGLGNDHIINHEQIDLKRVKLLEIVGSGRFGTVHKATLDETSEIAVKIIPNNEFQSWQNELKIYSSPKTRHPNILTFLGSTKSPDTNSHWLLVEYASNGSLHHYLKGNTVTWEEFLSISLGIVGGLSHLHDADVAHRDFKSKNVLLRHNLSPCITDFGVASLLEPSPGGSQHEHRKKYLQVGTPRYMAPEVLECSVAFTKISFTKIDVYALSLVLWELLSRCYPLPRSAISDYDDAMIMTSANSVMHHNRAPTSIRADEEAKVGLLRQAASATVGEDEVDGGPEVAMPSLPTNGLEVSIDMSRLATSANHQQPALPVYKMPFEEVVGLNPDISTMRQAVITEKLRPPIKPEWRLFPMSKLCQAIVDGWEKDHDARISASCFVERIESLQKWHKSQASHLAHHCRNDGM